MRDRTHRRGAEDAEDIARISPAIGNNDRCSLPNTHAYLLLSVDGQIHRLFGIRLGFGNPSRAVDPRNLLHCSEQRSLFLTKRAHLLTAHCGWANTQAFRLWLGFGNPSRAVDPRNLLRCSEQRSLFLTKRARLLTAHRGLVNTQAFRLWLGFGNPSRAVDPRNLLRCREQRSLFLTKRARLLTALCGLVNTQTFRLWLAERIVIVSQMGKSSS